MQGWSDRYDRDLADAFAIQTEVALEIAHTLGARLTASEKQLVERLPTKDREAYDLYLRGLYYFNRSEQEADSRTAKTLFEKALARDPSFALAHSFLSEADTALIDPDCVGAKEHADRAIALQPDLPAAHEALASFNLICMKDPAAAVREQLVAERGAPSDSGRVSRESTKLRTVTAGPRSKALGQPDRGIHADSRNGAKLTAPFRTPP